MVDMTHGTADMMHGAAHMTHSAVKTNITYMIKGILTPFLPTH